MEIKTIDVLLAVLLITTVINTFITYLWFIQC